MTLSLSNACPLHPPGPCTLKGSCLQVRKAWFYCKQTMVTVPLRNLPGKFSNIISLLYLWVSMYLWISQPGIKILQWDAGDMAPQFRALMLSPKAWVQFPAPISGRLQQPITPVPGTSDTLCTNVVHIKTGRHELACAHTHTHTFKSAGGKGTCTEHADSFFIIGP